MTTHPWAAAGAALLLALLLPFSAARADFEVTGPDGRRILLKDDGSWSYVETDKPAPEKKIVVVGEGVLTLEQMVDLGQNCRIGFRLKNDTNFEIRNIVPRFDVYRTNGVVYEGRTLGFFSINPGNSLYRETLFRGISCKDIGRIQVSGGDRCIMEDLDQFTYTGGACLERVRVVPSNLVKFEK